MIMVTVPHYRDLFEEPIPNLDELLDGIPSKVIIGLLAMIHSEFHLQLGDGETQNNILRLFLQRQPIDIQQKT